MSQIHIDDVEAIAANAYALFNQQNPKEPAWGGLPSRSRQQWIDVVHDFRRTPELAAKTSANLQEACVSRAVREFPPRPVYVPDLVVETLQAEAGKEKIEDAKPKSKK